MACIVLAVAVLLALTGVISAEYEGCYSPGVGTLYRKYRSISMTNEICVQKCAGLNKPYAGTKAGVWCYCGEKDTLTKGKKQEEGKCNKECKGDTSQMCGSFRHYSVYSTGKGKRELAEVLQELRGALADLEPSVGVNEKREMGEWEMIDLEE